MAPPFSRLFTMSDVFDFGLVPWPFTGVSCLTHLVLRVGQAGSMKPQWLLHLCSADEWGLARTRGEHRPGSLSDVGFIHLSSPEQVHLPANRLYAGRTDLVLLHIDPARLSSPIRWEPGVSTDPESMLFPHLYGPLPVTAVTSVTRYLPGVDGTFAPPLAQRSAPGSS
jgi:uncharacterized protein (DUF952 family)